MTTQNSSMPSSADAVLTDRLTHRYGERVALHELSLRVAPGEIVALLGPNGSGKTTLFRILSTLIAPQAGRAEIFGASLADPAGREQVRRQIGVVFQSPSLDKQLTAQENLLFHGVLFGLRGSALRSRAQVLLDRFDLRDRAADRVSTFSGGMRRRVEIAKGLVNQPRLLLLDEPSTGLDPVARAEVWKHLEHVRRSDGVTVLLTTHLMEEADRCDRVAILDGGRLAAEGSPASLKERVGGDVITVATRDPAGVRDILRDRFQVEAETSDSQVRLERPRGHEFVPVLIEALPAMVESVSVGKPTLEDVFLHVTGRQFRERG
jgi:ABC-2 type transport system ATP-binding protein